jgi:hypothetical protein
MKVGYSFCVLRYVHDPISQEFVNIGVVVFAPEASYLRAICTVNYGRITQLFQRIDGQRFRQLSRYIQEEICAMGRKREALLPFELGQDIEGILSKVLPPDDSAIQFSKPGVGLSADLDRTLQDAYNRYVDHYSIPLGAPTRTDEEVWQTFGEPLRRLHVTPRLCPKRIVASSYEYEFERSWRNQIWHVMEPVSFDMIDAGSMLDKANRWVGRATSLMDSSDLFSIHMLLGEPSDDRLAQTFIKAQNILRKMPGRREFVRESEADDFAEEVAREMGEYAS